MRVVRWGPRSFGFGAVLVLFLAALRPSSAPAQTPTNQSPSAVTPAPVPVDPATSSFATEAGVILIAIKPTMTDAYEAVVRALNEALVKDTVPGYVAVGWFAMLGPKGLPADMAQNINRHCGHTAELTCQWPFGALAIG